MIRTLVHLSANATVAAYLTYVIYLWANGIL